MNVGCIPSKSLLNNSHIYHQILHDVKNRGIDGMFFVSSTLPSFLLLFYQLGGVIGSGVFFL